VWCCLCDPTFSRFSRTPICDGQTGGQTDTGPWLVPRMHSIAREKLLAASRSGSGCIKQLGRPSCCWDYGCTDFSGFDNGSFYLRSLYTNINNRNTNRKSYLVSQTQPSACCSGYRKYPKSHLALIDFSALFYTFYYPHSGLVTAYTAEPFYIHVPFLYCCETLSTGRVCSICDFRPLCKRMSKAVHDTCS